MHLGPQSLLTSGGVCSIMCGCLVAAYFRCCYENAHAEDGFRHIRLSDRLFLAQRGGSGYWSSTVQYASSRNVFQESYFGLPSRRVIAGFRLGLDGLADESHCCLLGCSPTLSRIAPDTCADQVGPGILTTMDSWCDVVKRQFSGGEVFSAVLATAPITGVDVASVQLHHSDRAPIIAKQPDDSRYGDDQTGGPDEIMSLTFKLVLQLGDVRPG